MTNLIFSITAGSVIFLLVTAFYHEWKADQVKYDELKKKPEQPKVKITKHLREITFSDPEELNDLLNADYPEETLIAIVGNVETIEKGQALLKKDFKKITAITCTYEEIKS